jgi:hypothetical protein
MMKLYTQRRNYYELPFFLNYMVLKSNPFLQKFFYLKVRDIESKQITIEEGGARLTHYDIVKYLCKNFDNLFEKYTNYGTNILTKLQMIQLYNHQPPQAKLISPYTQVLETKQIDLVKIPNNNIPNIIIPKKEYHNPFTSKLGHVSDIKPIPNYQIEFLESNVNSNIGYNDYEMGPFDKIVLDTFTNDDGFEKLNLDRLYKPLSDFLNNYSPFEFPVFCLNFDYMRILTTILQSKVNQYVNEFQKLEKILNNIDIPRNRNIKPKISKSVSPPRNINKYELEENNRFNELLRKKETSIKPKKFLNKSLSKEEFLEKSMNKLIKKNSRPIFEKGLNILNFVFKTSGLKIGFNQLIRNRLNQKLEILYTNLTNIDSKINYRFKRFFFFSFFNRVMKSHEADNFYNFNLKRNLFNLFATEIQDKFEMSLAKYQNSLKVKAFYSLVKFSYDKEYKRNKFESLLYFNENRLKHKAFHCLKHLVKPNQYLKSDSLAYSNSLYDDTITFRGSNHKPGLKPLSIDNSHRENFPSYVNLSEQNNDIVLSSNPYDDVYDEINENYTERANDPKMTTNQLEFKHFGNNPDSTPSETFLDKSNENIFDNNLVQEKNEVDELLSKVQDKYRRMSKF